MSNEKTDVEKDSRPPPDAFLRRLESLENPARPPITVYTPNQRMVELKMGLSAEDREIAERLEKLKAERKRQRDLPTEEDIVRRLAALKGKDSDSAVERNCKRKPELFLPDTRSDEEKTNALIKQLIEEQILAVKHISREDLIAQRLARLRGENPTTAGCSRSQSDDVDLESLVRESHTGESKADSEDINELMQLAKVELDAVEKEVEPGMKKLKLGEEMGNDSSNSSDSEIEKVIQRARDEVALGDDEEELDIKDPSNAEPPEELPWCTICNEDATKRCQTCEDLFCTKCFAEFHNDDDELKDHKAIPYTSQVKE